MSERRKWPAWVTQTLKYEALWFVLPIYGVLAWMIGAAWILMVAHIIEPQWALLVSLDTSTIGGGMTTMLYFAIQSAANRNRLYNAGQEEASKRNLLARHYVSWQWFAFGWLIILISFIQPKRAAD